MKRARTLIALGALAAVAALAFWWIRQEAPAPQAADRAPVAREAPAPVEPPAPRIALAETQGATSAPEREVIEVASRAAVAANPPPQTIHGRLILIESDGSQIDDVDGTLELITWEGGMGSSQEIPVTNGEWSETDPAIEGVDGIDFEGALIEGRRATVQTPSDTLKAPFREAIVVRARFPQRSVLRIVDATQGTDLYGITLVKPQSFPNEDASHPGVAYETRIIGRNLTSPIAWDQVAKPSRSPFHQDVQRVLVGATDYAWTPVLLDLAGGGERVVELERGADLVLNLRGVDPKANALLRLRSDGVFAPWVEIPLRSDAQFKLQGMKPGIYQARGEIGKFFDSPLVLGETPLDLRAGEVTVATLLLEAAPPLELADASGTLFVPREWGARALTLSLELVDTPLEGTESHQSVNTKLIPSQRQGYATYTWARKALQVGRYELEIEELPFSMVFDLPREGRQDIDVTVPAPVELVVHVVDAETGAPMTTDELSWHPRRPDETHGGSFVDAESEGLGTYRIRSPVMEIDLLLFAWPYQPYHDRIDLRPGQREHVVRLARGCGFEIQLVDGSARIPFPDGWDVEVEALTGSGRRTLEQSGDIARKIMVSEPGTYALEMPQIAGYEPIPKQTIEVSAGQFTEHVVQLVRKH